MGWKLLQLPSAFPGFGTELTVAGGNIWGSFGRCHRQCRIFEAMYHIWDCSASEYIGLDIVWALSFTTLDLFNYRGNLVDKRSMDS